MRSLLGVFLFVFAAEAQITPRVNSIFTPSSETAKWSEVAPDLDFAQITLPGTSIFRSEIVAFRSSLKRFSLTVLKATEIGAQRSTVHYLADSASAIVAINGSFFDEFGRPLGLILSRGIITQPMQRRGNTLTAVLTVSNGQPHIINRAEFKTGGVTEALQAGPRLLRDGIKVTGLEERDEFTRRSGVCIDRKGALILYATSSRLKGVSLLQLQDTLLYSLSCVDALNLDGGGSSQLYFRGFATRGIDELSLEGHDLIPNAIGLVASRIDN